MSRPTINRPESSDAIRTEDVKTVRSNSLHPLFDYIKNESSIFNKLINAVNVDKNNYNPKTDIKPVLETDRKHINSCISMMMQYLDCRDINPEYHCEEIREYMLKIKCI